MWWTILAVVVPIVGLTPWNRLQKKWRLLVLVCLTMGIIALPIRSHLETVGNEETIRTLRTQLSTAEQKLVESDMVRKKILEHAGIAKLNADGLKGLVKKGGVLTESSPITPNPELIWLYSGQNGENRNPKCDKEGMETAKQMIEKHPTFPFSYFVLAFCHRANGEQEWIAYAQGALDILEFTTQVPGHNGHHVTVKQRLEDWMRER